MFCFGFYGLWQTDSCKYDIKLFIFYPHWSGARLIILCHIIIFDPQKDFFLIPWLLFNLSTALFFLPTSYSAITSLSYCHLCCLFLYVLIKMCSGIMLLNLSCCLYLIHQELWFLRSICWLKWISNLMPLRVASFKKEWVWFGRQAIKLLSMMSLILSDIVRVNLCNIYFRTS